jgi:hypothetical protein
VRFPFDSDLETAQVSILVILEWEHHSLVQSDTVERHRQKTTMEGMRDFLVVETQAIAEICLTFQDIP